MKKPITLLDKQFDLYIPEAEILRAVQKVADAVARDYKDQVPIFIGVRSTGRPGFIDVSRPAM